MFAASVSYFFPTVPRDTFAVKDRLAPLAFLTDRRRVGGDRASKYSRPDDGRDVSGSFHHTQNHLGAVEEVMPAVVGEDWQIIAGSRAK